MIKVMLYVSIGTVAMLLPMVIVAANRKTKLWKSLPVAFYATVTGTLSTYLWFFLENQWIGGISFFGAVFLVPMAFLLMRKPLREPYDNMMDMFAAGICMMLAVMKVQCLTSGCCGGRVLYYDANAVAVVFPSQLAELANAVVLMLVLLIMGIKNRNRGRLYPWFMILYGVTRFVLNIFRQEWVTYDGPLMPLGNIWSLLALAAGIVWLVVLHRRAKTATENP